MAKILILILSLFVLPLSRAYACGTETEKLSILEILLNDKTFTKDFENAIGESFAESVCGRLLDGKCSPQNILSEDYIVEFDKITQNISGKTAEICVATYQIGRFSYARAFFLKENKKYTPQFFVIAEGYEFSDSDPSIVDFNDFEEMSYDDGDAKYAYIKSYRIMPSLFLVSAAPSFDCKKAETNIEKMICGDKKLSYFDYELAHNYKIAKSGAKDAKALSAEQREWLKTRNACKDAACLSQTYADRINQLCAKYPAQGCVSISETTK